MRSRHLPGEFAARSVSANSLQRRADPVANLGYVSLTKTRAYVAQLEDRLCP